MDPTSPLTRDVHESFQPKIVQLYSTIFTLTQQDQDEVTFPSEGFWREFFLLKSSRQRFHNILEPLTAVDILSIQLQTRNYIKRSISEIKSGHEPQAENALENLAAFLVAVLAKRFPNPSTDVIEIVAGLGDIDKVMTDFVSSLDSIISNHKSNPNPVSSPCRMRAIECAIAAIAGSYQTSLLTYFIQKDLFHGLMKFVQTNPEIAPTCLCLLGLLANHNKFEVQNVYQSRMEDFVNEEIMIKLVEGSANTCGDIRDAFIAIQDDVPAQWSIGSTLSYVGLSALAPKAEKPPPTEEEAKVLFNALPPAGSAILLSTYSFTQANNIFATQLISTDKDEDLESRLAAFLSVSSYLCHHAFRSTRMEHYALLTLFTIRALLDDSIIAKRLSSSDFRVSARLARQRPPHLPYIATPRIPTTIIFDIAADALSHNLRKRISISLYSTTLSILHSAITQLSNNRTRLPHHWSYIWLSLVSLLRFLTTYAADLLATSRLHDLRTHILTPLTSILTFSLLHGDNFLPDPPSYDDLFYKLLELDAASSSVLSKFTSAYEISSLPVTSKLRRATEALTSISGHYASLLLQSKKKIHQSPKEIQKLIGEGHETFGEVVDNISVAGSGRGGVATDAGFGNTEKWRESDWKVEIKKIIRTVVDDARVLALR